jgi:uncharacterized ion transporter superfamily protein YfcC
LPFVLLGFSFLTSVLWTFVCVFVRKLKPNKTKRQTNIHKTLVRKLKPNKTKRQTKVHKTLVRKLKPNKAKRQTKVHKTLVVKLFFLVFCGLLFAFCFFGF